MTDLEADELVAFRLRPLDDVAHARARRPSPRPIGQRADRCSLTLDHRLDAAVDAVAHPSTHAAASRLGLHRAAVEDTLHAAGDVKVQTHGASAADLTRRGA